MRRRCCRAGRYALPSSWPGCRAHGDTDGGLLEVRHVGGLERCDGGAFLVRLDPPEHDLALHRGSKLGTALKAVPLRAGSHADSTHEATLSRPSRARAAGPISPGCLLAVRVRPWPSARSGASPSGLHNDRIQPPPPPTSIRSDPGPDREAAFKEAQMRPLLTTAGHLRDKAARRLRGLRDTPTRRCICLRSPCACARCRHASGSQPANHSRPCRQPHSPSGPSCRLRRRGKASHVPGLRDEEVPPTQVRVGATAEVAETCSLMRPIASVHGGVL